MIYSKQLRRALTELRNCKGIMKVNVSDLQRKSVISRGTYKVSSVKKLLNLANDTGYDLHIV